MSTFKKIMFFISAAAGTAAAVKPQWAAWLLPVSAIAANFNGGSSKQNGTQE